MKIGSRMRAVPAKRGAGFAHVIDPATGRRLPERGSVVVVDRFWLRRELDGSALLEPLTPTTPGVSTDGPTDNEV